MKKLLAVLLSLTVACLLWGCNNPEGNDPANGWRISKIYDCTDSEDGYLRQKYEYSADGKTAEVEFYNKDGSIAGRNTITYKDNATQGIKTFDAEGNPTGTTRFKYNKHGDMGLCEYYNAEGEKTITLEYSPNYQDGRLMQETVCQDGEEIGVNKYTYNSQGLLAERRIYMQDTLTKIEKFDSRGNLIESISVKADGTQKTTETHEFIYDENGNIQKDTYRNGEGIVVNCSTFEYVNLSGGK